MTTTDDAPEQTPAQANQHRARASGRPDGSVELRFTIVTTYRVER